MGTAPGEKHYCGDCRAGIVWASVDPGHVVGTASYIVVPINADRRADENDTGPLVGTLGKRFVVRPAADGDTGPRYTPHWETCPTAAEWAPERIEYRRRNSADHPRFGSDDVGGGQ